MNLKSYITITIYLLLCACSTDTEIDTGIPPEIAFSMSSWGVAEIIENNTGDASAQRIAIDSSGNVIAVWRHSDGTSNNIWANKYTVNTGWGTPELIESTSGFAFNPDIAIDEMGNALALWEQFDGSNYNILANRYTLGVGWGAAELIETDITGEDSSPKIAIDANGNAQAVWFQYDIGGVLFNIWSNRYTFGAGWGTPELLKTSSTRFSPPLDGPQISINAYGNAVTVWQEYDGSVNNIWASYYEVGIGWSMPELIEENDNNPARVKIVIDSIGDAIAVWDQHDGAQISIWSNRYTYGVGWGTPEVIETENSNFASNPQISINATGNAQVVWQQHDGTRHNIWANRYTINSGWGNAIMIESDNADNALSPHIDMDSAGNALSVWKQSDGTRYNIWSNRYIVGIGWGIAELIETNDDGESIPFIGESHSPQISLDATGHAISVWTQFDGAQYNIWANEFK